MKTVPQQVLVFSSKRYAYCRFCYVCAFQLLVLWFFFGGCWGQNSDASSAYPLRRSRRWLIWTQSQLESTFRQVQIISEKPTFCYQSDLFFVHKAKSQETWFSANGISWPMVISLAQGHPRSWSWLSVVGCPRSWGATEATKGLPKCSESLRNIGCGVGGS